MAHYLADEKIMKFHFILICLAFLTLAMTPHAKAKETPNFENFGAWPVLHDGRIKTIESFARSVFFTISGETSLHNISATEWMANTLFDPASTISSPFIKIGRQDVLDLPAQDDKYYSMNDVMGALSPHQDMLIALEDHDPSMLSASQKELLNVYHAITVYNQIIQSFSAVLPLQGQSKTTYLDGGGVAAQRDLIAEGGLDNTLLKFIPNENPSLPLISLWQSINDNQETPIIDDIQIMAKAWNEGDYQTWNDLSKKVKDELQSQNDISLSLVLEHYYVTIDPMLWLIGFYVLGCIVMVSNKTKFLSPWVISGGFIMHLIALLTRSIILSRPPTGTLYETLLFGSAIIVMVGLLVFYKNKNHLLFLGICSISAAFLLFISRGFIQGDSLNVLVAVLNTNFWLSTHVTCIIIGYAFCIMAAMVGHAYLWSQSATSDKLMVPLTLCALLFTSIGTLLGGIWADQSWGRFWGWDPKENGALLIVLWLAWILHGRVSRHFKKSGFAAALGLTNIMVALTWFGVNLLGVGLHSYGFISGIAWGLGSFIIFQILIIAALYFKNQKIMTHD